MFRAESVGTAFDFYGAMFRFDGAGFSDVYASSITQLQLATMLIAMIVLIVRGAMVHQQTAAAPRPPIRAARLRARSEEHTSELQSLMRISYAVFCLKKKNRHPS